MKTLYIFAGIALIITIALVTLIFKSQNNNVSDLDTISFTNNDGEVSFLTTRSDGSAIYKGLGYESGVIVYPTYSTSGSKYEDIEIGLVVWNQDNELIVAINEEIIFSGNTTEPEPDKEPKPLSPSTEPKQPITPSDPQDSITKKCYVGGCSSHVCSDNPDIITTCEFREEYACYQSATCEQQINGDCGWTQTSKLQACIANSNN